MLAVVRLILEFLDLCVEPVFEPVTSLFKVKLARKKKNTINIKSDVDLCKV